VDWATTSLLTIFVLTVLFTRILAIHSKLCPTRMEASMHDEISWSHIVPQRRFFFFAAPRFRQNPRSVGRRIQRPVREHVTHAGAWNNGDVSASRCTELRTGQSVAAPLAGRRRKRRKMLSHGQPECFKSRAGRRWPCIALHRFVPARGVTSNAGGRWCTNYSTAVRSMHVTLARRWPEMQVDPDMTHRVNWEESLWRVLLCMYSLHRE
jgi:hypothetical protein